MQKTVMGIQVAYTEAGDGTLVVLLHGWGSNRALYQPIVDVISTKYKAVAPDFPGFGESKEPPTAWDVGNYADFLIEFLKDYHADRVILVGHSFGGRVIFKLFEKETLPFQIEKIILVDSAGIRPKKTRKQKFLNFASAFVKRTLTIVGLGKIAPKILQSLGGLFGSADYKAASGVIRETLVKVVNEDLSHVFPKISVPTLIIWGEQDTATPLSDAKRMEAEIKDSGLVTFPGCGHYSFLENPVLFRNVVASFLNITNF